MIERFGLVIVDGLDHPSIGLCQVGVKILFALFLAFDKLNVLVRSKDSFRSCNVSGQSRTSNFSSTSRTRISRSDSTITSSIDRNSENLHMLPMQHPQPLGTTPSSVKAMEPATQMRGRHERKPRMVQPAP